MLLKVLVLKDDLQCDKNFTQRRIIFDSKPSLFPNLNLEKENSNLRTRLNFQYLILNLDLCAFTQNYLKCLQLGQVFFLLVQIFINPLLACNFYSRLVSGLISSFSLESSYFQFKFFSFYSVFISLRFYSFLECDFFVFNLDFTSSTYFDPIYISLSRYTKYRPPNLLSKSNRNLFQRETTCQNSYL